MKLRRVEMKRLADCKPDIIMLQQTAQATLNTIKEQDITGKSLLVTLDGNITDIQHEYAEYRTICIRFQPDEALSFHD